MKIFLDTSSLIKLYHQEEGSDFVMNVLSKDDVEEIFLSELAVLEFRSALWKKIRENEIEEKTAVEVIRCFQNDWENYQWIALQSGIIELASSLLMKYGIRGLRTLDSLQLASALALKDEECAYLTADKLLRSLFEVERLHVL